MGITEQLRQAHSVGSCVLAMPNPDDSVSAIVFARWVDSTLDDYFADDELVDTDDIADMVQRARTELEDSGYTVLSDAHNLWVFSAVPAGAPTTLEDLAELVDPKLATAAVSRIMAILGAAESWNSDVVSDVADTLERIARELQPLPPINSTNVGVLRYWEALPYT